MGQLLKVAAIKDAQTMSEMEESALGMGQGPLKESAAMKNAPTKLRKEESASDMEQRVQLAVMKDVPTTYGEEESAGVMERRSITRPGCTKSKRTVSVKRMKLE